jgi:threonine/homoserine/homoserine lactone efflux protein
LLPLIFALEAGWYAVVAALFSAGRPRALYIAAKLWIDRIAGSVMAALGLRLIAETSRSG